MRRMAAFAPLLQLIANSVLIVCLAIHGLSAADCNQNGFDDTIEMAGVGLKPVGSYITGVMTESLVPADMDADGDLDLVAAGQAVGVFLNDGSGDFSLGSLSRPPGGLESATVADFDGDGDPDVAVTSANEKSVSLLLNEGGGVLGAEVKSFDTGRFPVGIASGDLDGDGDIDIVTADFGGDSLSILHNEGGGTFRSVQTLAHVEDARTVLVSDLDGDGALDLATSSDSNVLLFFNDGGGFFPEPARESGGRAWSISAGDLDGDGDVDLVVATGHSIVTMLNLGDRNFQIGLRTHLGDEARIRSVAIGHLDADGAPDLLAVAWEGMWTLLNDGDGSFTSVLEHDGSGESASILDVDGDGDSDLLTTDLVVLNQGDGTFGPARVLSLGGGAIWGDGIASGDLDGDGDLDLITTNGGDGFCSSSFGCGANTISVFWNQGKGEFLGPALSPTGRDPHSVRTADLDGDGDLDLLTSNGSSRDLSVLLNNGVGEFFETRYEGTGAPVEIGDLDGDGDPDLLGTERNRDVVPESENLFVFLNLGDGTFSMRREPIENLSGFDPSVELGDWDGDGDLDVVRLATEGSNRDPQHVVSVTIIRNRGDGTFDSPMETVFTVDGFFGDSLTLEDLDADGDLDLVAFSPALVPHLGIILNEGGELTTITLEQPDAHMATTGDIDGDGDPDIIVTNWDSVGVWLNDGNGNFDASGTVPVDVGHVNSLTVGDYNGDGRLDLAATADPNVVSVLLNLGLDADAVPENCEGPFVRGDCNEDGRVDVSDPVCILNWLFAGGPEPGCVAVTNANGDDSADLTDATYLLNHLFLGRPAPVDPYPDCGPGTLPADDELGCANPLDCQ